MRWGPLLLCSWPGLARLWYRGYWSSLLVAIGFSILVNIALVSSFLWPWSLGDTFPFVVWPVILAVWTASARISYRNLPDLMAVGQPPGETMGDASATLFIQAQREYLKGHWTESESLLTRRLDRQPRDIEARLLLATLYRHQRQMQKATSELLNLERFDESIHWEFEIRRERELIELIRNQADDEEMPHGDPSPVPLVTE